MGTNIIVVYCKGDDKKCIHTYIVLLAVQTALFSIYYKV